MVKNITFYCLQFEKSTYLCTWLWPMQGLDFLNNNNIDIQILENFLLMKSSNQNIWGALYLVAALLLSASCSEYNPDMSEGNLTKEEYEKVMEFTKNFKLRYGEIAPDNDWGFGELEVKGSRGVKGTRLYAEPDMNGWFSDGSTIPGLPSPIDRKYHYVSNSGNFVTYDTEQGRVDQHNPIGDVTDEEIVYVSHWFRTHYMPKSKEVNLTDFYIQNISQDCDRISYPSGKKKTLQNEDLRYKMDQLMAVQSSNNAVHCYNFNADNSNRIPEELPEYTANDSVILFNTITNPLGWGNLDYCKYRTMMRMKDGSDHTPVTSFSAHASDGDNTIDDYVLVHIEFIGPKSGKKYSGDYLGFDYSIHKANGSANMDRDGYYSNWILKISPAYPPTTPDPEYTTETKRVMCEDLGNTYDFDFNDLVFDVYYTYKDKTNITAHITLQAVGGTLPIYIGKTNTTELHRAMLGYESYVPINVAASNGVTHSPVSFTISAKSTDPNDIDIIVRNPDAKGAITDIILPKSGESNLAPQKICMPFGTMWLKENQQIEWGYTKFQDWVNNGRNTEYDVWTTGIQEDFLYK